MDINKRLIDIMVWMDEEVRRWSTGLSDEERAAHGRPDAWAARDLLVHFVEWGEFLCLELEAIAEERELPIVPEIEETNRAFFERNQGVGWAALAEKDRAWRAAASVLLATLKNDIPHMALRPDDPPLWRSIIFSTVFHTLRHLSENLIARGHSAAANRLMEEGMRRMVEMNDDPQYIASLQYNLACHYALNGQPDQSLTTLAKALAIARNLAEYAGRDEDFASLIEDAKFRELINPS
jgi:hypothetical protein